MLRYSEAANYADLLALLLAHGMPLPEAIVLCAEASGDRGLMRDSQTVVEAIERGDGIPDAFHERSHFPPLLRWLLATGARQGDLPAALKHLAQVYRRRAAHEAEKVRVLLPTLLLCAIGASATFVYALTLFLPWTAFLARTGDRLNTMTSGAVARHGGQSGTNRTTVGG